MSANSGTDFKTAFGGLCISTASLTATRLMSSFQLLVLPGLGTTLCITPGLFKAARRHIQCGPIFSSFLGFGFIANSDEISELQPSFLRGAVMVFSFVPAFSTSEGQKGEMQKSFAFHDELPLIFAYLLCRV